MPVPLPQPSRAKTPRARKNFTPEQSTLRPIFTHGRPSATRYTPNLLVPCNATANLLTTPHTATPLTPTTSETEDHTTAVAISPSGLHAVLALRSGRVHIVLLPSFQLSKSFKPFQDRAVVSHIAFDASGTYVTLLSADGNVRVHNVENADPTHVYRDAANGVLLSAVAFHPVPTVANLLLGAEDGSVLLCDLRRKNATPRLLAKLHVASVLSFAFAQKGSVLVTASADRLLCFAKWDDVKNGKLVACGENLVSVVSPGEECGNVVFSLGERGVIRRWFADKAREDVDGSLVLPFVSKRSETQEDGDDGEDDDDDDDSPALVLPTSMTMCGPNELVVALSDHTLLYVPVSSSGELSPVRKVVCGNLEEIYDLRALPYRENVNSKSEDVEQEFAIASNSSTVWVMGSPSSNAVASASEQTKSNLENGNQANDSGSWNCRAALRGHTGIILCVDSLINEKGVGKGNHSDAYLATSSRDKSARVWRRSRRTGGWACMALAEGHTDSVGAVAISPRAASGQFCIVTGAADRTIKLWSLDQAQKVAERKEREQTEKKNAKGNEAVPLAWAENDDDTEAQKLSAKWTCLAHDKDINAVAISPDVKLVATGSQDRTVKLWDAGKGTLRVVCKGHRRGVWTVAFSNVDRIAASGSADATVRIWSVADGSCLRSFQGHLSGVLRCAFISSGTQLASAGGDGLLKIWATRTGECVTTLDAHDDRAWGLDKIGDGNILVSGGADGQARIWRDTTEEEAAAEVAKRNEEALMEQQVQNAARAGKWSSAARGALKLDMTQKLRSVLADLISKCESPHDELMRMIREIHDDGDSKDENEPWELTTKLFLCCRNWNASGGAKNAAIAAYVLQALFSLWTPEQLCDSLNIDKRPLVEGLEAHCKRHLERVSAFGGKINVLDYTLGRMHALGKIENSEKNEDEIERKKKQKLKMEVDEDEEKRKEIARRKRRKREEHPGDY